jgi:hypothetical protein
MSVVWFALGVIAGSLGLGFALALTWQCRIHDDRPATLTPKVDR